MRCVIRNCGTLLAVAGVMWISTAFAQDAATQTKPPVESSISIPPASADSQLPSCLQELKLTPEQQSQIQTIMRGHEVDIALVWKQFSDRYMDAIRTEAMLQCAIEDHLTDAQRTQVQEQRRRVAQRQSSLTGTPSTANEANGGLQSPDEEHHGLAGVVLTSEQESAADAVEDTYRTCLRSHNRDIANLHARLLSLEADKFVEIEMVLTQDQLKQLRKIRQIAPPVSGEQFSIKRQTRQPQ
jgi:hypothetical protein